MHGVIEVSEGLLFKAIILIGGFVASIFTVRLLWRDVSVPWTATQREEAINQFTIKFSSESYNNIGIQWTSGLQQKARNLIDVEETTHIWVAMAEANAAKDRNRQLDLAIRVIQYLTESTVINL